MNIIKKLYNLLFNPTINSVFLCRLTLKIYEKKHKYIARHFRNRVLHKYGIHIGLGCKIGSGLTLPHPLGIVIGEGVVIGKNCTIYHQVTLGKKMGNLDSKRDYPIIGDNVTIFAGAKITGNIRVGDNSIIATNSVVLSDVEPNSIYAGVPAKKIKSIPLGK